MTVFVHPDEIHQAGSVIREVAGEWCRSVQNLESVVTDTSGLGADALGSALTRMNQQCAGPAVEYLDRTGKCASETGFVVHEMARAYEFTEQDNVARAARITSLLSSLGVV